MNVTSIRQKVAQAISKAPTKVIIYRQNKVSDGCGGYILDQNNPVIRVGQFEGVLDNSNAGGITDNSNPGGRVAYSKSPQFITIWKNGVTFKKGDYFLLNGKKYEIYNPVNILNMNIYWQLDLLVYIDEEEGQ